MTSRTPPTTTSTTTPPRTPHIDPPSDSETDAVPTPLHSPGGPQYDDLPPSYDTALRSDHAPLDASQLEAHRVSAGEGPNEPEVWEYRVRGESVVDEQEQGAAGEEAPAYDGHVPVQHVRGSQDVPVGRVEDPPHSVPESDVPLSNAQWDGAASQFGFAGRGAQRARFGHGMHGVPRYGAASRRGAFGRGRGGPGLRAGGGPQDWASFGQGLGRMGEEFGRRMGEWGEQFGRQMAGQGEMMGRQATAMGEQIGRQAGATGRQAGRGSGAWAAAYSGGGVSVSSVHSTGSSGMHNEPPQYEPPQYEAPPRSEPPSYQGTAAGQETGILYNDRKAPTHQPETASTSSEHTEKKTPNIDTYDSDSDSVSSLSSDSDSDSDSDSTEPSPLKRARTVQKRALKARKRELIHEYRAAKREHRGTHNDTPSNSEAASTKGKGKGKSKAKASAESTPDSNPGAWKAVKKDFRARRRALKNEQREAKRVYKRQRREAKQARKTGGLGRDEGVEEKRGAL